MRCRREVYVFAATLPAVVCHGGAILAQCDPDESVKLLAPDGAINDGRGLAVSISGDVAVAAAYRDDANDDGMRTGSAYVYRWDGSSWIEEQKLVASDGQAEDWFGFSVAIDGDVAIVGARRDDDRGADTGSAYVFRWSGSSWVEEVKLAASDGAAGDLYGTAVSISGGAAVVGAIGDDDRGSSSGSAYPYRWNGASWIEEPKLTASDGAANDAFGAAVSIKGNAMIVGASADDDDGESSGAAYVFRDKQSSWTEEQKLNASDGAAFDLFGSSVALSSNVAIVGAMGDDDSGSASGSAYVYRWNDSSWVEEEKLRASDGATEDEFGVAVAMSGAEGTEVAVVGARRDDDNGSESGSAYVFHHDGSNWDEEHRLLASDGAQGDAFGFSVSVSADTAIVGAPNDDDTGNVSGSAYVFDLNCPHDCPADIDGNGAVDFDDLLRILDAWGNKGGPEDLDGSGTVDFGDLLIVLDSWGPCPK